MSRRLKFILAVLAALILLGAVFVERAYLDDLRRERDTLAGASQEAEQLEHENQQLAAAAVAETDLEALRAATRDLPRLRNEIRQLRDQAKALDKLRAENEQVARQLQSGAVAPASLAQMEGFVARESWASAGFNTPEAALQTWFWAMREKNLEQLADCLEPKERSQLLKEIAEMSEDERRRMAEALGAMTRTKGFRIAERNTQGEDKIVFGVQVAAGGELLKVNAQRHGSEWKLANFGTPP